MNITQIQGAWTVRIDDILSSALEEGPLRTEEYVLPEEIKQKLAAMDIPKKLRRYAEDMTAFYYANKHDDCEYVVFPVANFNAYYGSTTFSKKKLPSSRSPSSTARNATGCVG